METTRTTVYYTALISIAVYFCFFGAFLRLNCRSNFEREAISVGAAVYQCDQATGECVFEWAKSNQDVP